MAGQRKLGKPTDQRVALVYNQASQLLWHGKIETTVDRAKEVRKVAEKIITLAVRTYDDTVEVSKQKLNLKNQKVEVKVVNDGPKKLAARRKMMAILADLQEEKAEKESKKDFKLRTKDVKHPLIEKIFTEYGPKYRARAEEKGQGGGYTRILKLGNRRGDDAEMAIIELV